MQAGAGTPTRAVEAVQPVPVTAAQAAPQQPPSKSKKSNGNRPALSEAPETADIAD